MPGSAREVANAEEEGVEFVWLSSPKEFKGTNKIENLIVDQIQLGEPDDSGRRRPEVKAGSEFKIKADMVIKALGFDPEDLPYLFDAKELQVTKWGTLKTDFDTMETNLKGVFAAADKWGIDLKNCKVVIQGFGNVGSYAAKFLEIGRASCRERV